MKKNLIFITNFIFLTFLSANTAFADDFIMPDWSYYTFRENYKITENSDEIKYTKIRKEHNFDDFFDRQTIIIHKKHKNLTPKTAGVLYLAKIADSTKNTEKYIIKDNQEDFIACYCSQDKRKCEIVRFYDGFDGLVEVRYTHNNLWHFQNNIGSFITAQMNIQHLPYEFTINKLSNGNKIIRL